MRPLDFGIPAGSLQEATIELFRRAGWHIVVSPRSYFPEVDDDDLRLTLMRAQEMSRYVQHGTFDAGITGKDWTLENESDVKVIQVLPYSRRSSRPTRTVLAVRSDSPVKTIHDLEGRTIAAEMVGFTRRYLADRGIDASVEFSWGATEAKVAGRLADAIVETTETGSTLRAHGLREIETMLTSCTPDHRQQDRLRRPGQEGQDRPGRHDAQGRSRRPIPRGSQDERPEGPIGGDHRPRPPASPRPPSPTSTANPGPASKSSSKSSRSANWCPVW